MAAQALYRKWRSQTFEEVIGQEHVTRTLRNALRDGRIAHAYLFAGPRGTGKTSTARLLAKAVNCLNQDPKARPDTTCDICQAISAGSLLDLLEIDAASNRGIDEIRDLREKVHFSPSRARHKVYVIDEVHMLTPEAFNALLKTLEEPPAHVIFVLATTEPHKIPDTVLSRCQRFDFRRIPPRKIVERLDHILSEEGRSAEPAALDMIARGADGSMRDAISLTDQLLSYGGDTITEAQVQAVRGTVTNQAIAELVDLMAVGDAAGGLTLINEMAAEGIDLRQLTLQLLAHLRAVLLTVVGGGQARTILTDLSDDQLAVVRNQAQQLAGNAVTHAVRLFNQASLEMRDAAQPQLILELAWLEAVQPALSPPAPTVSGEQPGAISISAASGPPPTVFGQEVDQERPVVAVASLPRAGEAVPDERVVSVLRAHWAALLQAAETARGPALKGALRTLRNVVASGGEIYFAFEHEFAKDRVERPGNKAVVQDLLAQLLGRPVRLHCQVGQQVTGVKTSQEEVRPKPDAASADEGLADDPVVQHAQRNLGAVPGQVRAEDS